MEMILQLVEKRVRTFRIHCFSGSCRCCQDQILIFYLFNFILFYFLEEGILLFLQQIFFFLLGCICIEILEDYAHMFRVQAELVGTPKQGKP